MFPNLKIQELKTTLRLLEVSLTHNLSLDDLTLFLAHFRWGGKKGGDYDPLSLSMMEDKSYGNPNP